MVSDDSKRVAEAIADKVSAGTPCWPESVKMCWFRAVSVGRLRRQMHKKPWKGDSSDWLRVSAVVSGGNGWQRGEGDCEKLRPTEVIVGGLKWVNGTGDMGKN